MILIDPPTWPAHGTVFSHLVSNSSLEELHAFAQSAGVAERAFDVDHYDVPLKIYDDLIAAGAIPVSAKELFRALRASGLRVKAKHRGKSAAKALQFRWDSLMFEPNTAAETRSAIDSLGQDLRARWSEPHRHYHSTMHLLAVLEALDTLCDGNPPKNVVLAAWFHDAVYNGIAGQDEDESAKLAQLSLIKIWPEKDIREVVRLVLLTKTHAPDAGDDFGALLCDADLAILGSEPQSYARYSSDVRLDYAHFPDSDFARGRLAILKQLRTSDHLFHTAKGRQLWGEEAIRNLDNEIAQLS